MSGNALKRGLSVFLGGRKPRRGIEFDVTRASVKDVDDLVVLSETFRGEHSAEWGEGSLAQWARWQVKASVQSPDNAVMIARAGGTPVGYAAASVDRSGVLPIGKVEALYVLPGMRGTGLAARLLGAALEALARNGAGHVELIVAADNARALAFFAGFGFRPGDRVMGVRMGPNDSNSRE